MKRAMGWALAALMGLGGAAYAQSSVGAPGNDPSYHNAPVNPFGMKGKGTVGSSAATGMQPTDARQQQDANAQRANNGQTRRGDLDAQRFGRNSSKTKKARRHGHTRAPKAQKPVSGQK